MAHATHDTMQAVAIDRFGGLDELKMHDLPRPEPADDEVVIRVRAAGVGIWDSMQRSGSFPPDDPHFPLVLGGECAGTVESLGRAVTGFAHGEDVYTYFTGKQGAYAQFVAVKAAFVARKPRSLSFEEAAAVPVDAITAHQALFDALKIREGETVFVAGGAGGVGTMAVQLVQIGGATPVASAQASNFEYLEALGVRRENLVDYTQSDVVAAVMNLTAGQGVDAALDAVGGDNAKTTVKTVRQGGRFAELMESDVSPAANVKVSLIESEPSGTRLDTLRDLFDSGSLKVHIEKVFPLAHAREALALVESRKVRGKVVLQVA